MLLNRLSQSFHRGQRLVYGQRDGYPVIPATALLLGKALFWPRATENFHIVDYRQQLTLQTKCQIVHPVQSDNINFAAIL